MLSQSSLLDIAVARVVRNVDSQFLREHSVLIVGTASILFIFLVVRYISSPWRKLPPGPPGLPLLGNALQVGVEQWLQYSAWRRRYGMSSHSVGVPCSISSTTI